ncbi:TatD family hydrolase [Candidatus Collierbacteria bacterium]|nr:TatD family hydrolase [Candidatus Collierbacteria bacterium]
MLIDTHCHLTDERLVGQIDEVLGRARAAGVIKIISPSTSLEDARKVVEIAGKYDEVFGLVGVHPEKISELRITNDELWAEIERMVVGNKKIVGIGEIGLDFHYDVEKKSKDRQIAVFQEQLELAVELGLPVAIHMREAEAEMIEVLGSMKKLPAGQFHCWAGSEELLKKVIELSFYVSFCGNITFKSADNLRRLIKIVPPDRLLFETDSPYLSPEPRRGSQNEPANVTILAEYIANLLGSPIETLINQTTANAKCLYFGG